MADIKKHLNFAKQDVRLSNFIIFSKQFNNGID